MCELAPKQEYVVNILEISPPLISHYHVASTPQASYSLILAPTSEGGSGGTDSQPPPPPPTPPDYCERSRNRNLCLPPTYSKFELPFVDDVNVVEIGIDISDVLRIDDKVRKGEQEEREGSWLIGGFHLHLAWMEARLPRKKDKRIKDVHATLRAESATLLVEITKP